MAGRQWLRLPVVSAGSEYLVMGHLMRRNILTYKAPPGNEGYDLIAIHPDPRYKPTRHQQAQVRIQVKSRYASDCNRSFPLKCESLDAFDFLVVAFLNIGKFYGRNDGSSGDREAEFFTLPPDFVREHHSTRTSWEKVVLRGLERELDQFAGMRGFEQIARTLGVERPQKIHPPRPRSRAAN